MCVRQRRLIAVRAPDLPLDETRLLSEVLRRVESDVLVNHLSGICRTESVEAEDEALAAGIEALTQQVEDMAARVERSAARQ